MKPGSIHSLGAMGLATLMMSACAQIPVAADSRLNPTAATSDAGYYYSGISSSEPVSTIANPSGAGKEERAAVLSRLAILQRARGSGDFYILAEGDALETMIISARPGSRLNSKYQARALMGDITAVARNGKLFQEYGVQTEATFFDMAKIWGFESIIVTNGENFAHQFLIQ